MTGVSDVFEGAGECVKLAFPRTAVESLEDIFWSARTWTATNVNKMSRYGGVLAETVDKKNDHSSGSDVDGRLCIFFEPRVMSVRKGKSFPAHSVLCTVHLGALFFFLF